VSTASPTLASGPPRAAALPEAGEALVADFAAELRAAVPPGTAMVDAHAHVGLDVDGMVGDADELLAMLAQHGVARAFVFSLNEPDRDPDFRAPNDRTLACAERSGGRLVAFARLALEGDPVAEAERCITRGARGIKLHPRAQRFALADARLDGVFAVAAERRVPVLVHAGPGIGDGFAAGLERLLDAHPGALLIVAHAGVGDLAEVAQRFAGRPDVAVDTSTWSALDVIDLLGRMPPEQVLHASDYPYGQQPSALAVALLAARASGAGDGELAALLGGSAARFAAGKPLGRLSPVRGAAAMARPLVLDRVHHHLTMAASLLLSRRGDALGALELAVAAASERRDDLPELERIRPMLQTARGLWASLRAAETDAERRTVARLAIQLLQLAAVLAVTCPSTSEER
jgi:uncharacterized protein